MAPGVEGLEHRCFGWFEEMDRESIGRPCRLLARRLCVFVQLVLMSKFAWVMV